MNSKMLRPIAKTNNLLKFFVRDVGGPNSILYASRVCYPVSINLNDSYVSSSALTRHRIDGKFCPLNVNKRYKTTAVKEDGSKKAEEEAPKVEVEISEGPALTTREKLRKAVKEYGATVIVFHVGISLASLGTCYLLVSSRNLSITSKKLSPGSGRDESVRSLGHDRVADEKPSSDERGTFAVAYAVHKVFAPVRITVTLASVPLIVRYLRKIGFLKK
ncbi:hypothetical protein NQ318_019846 [Aromia moschata]|uniref:DUF1279 domain-containing protein n=1 Tax=Aromia moschata TaxID=1265417 RepID=A0AAV8YMJ9_9CUCU|nr:hypothetical protein NQ318_019846 [Aromia moschata]